MTATVRAAHVSANGGHALQIAPGTIIAGKYRLEAPLAQGGMGAVWRARHVQLHSELAIKFMAPNVASSASGRTRFEREARAAAHLQYVHIIKVQDFGVEDDTPYIVMELLHGESLEERLQREFRLSLEALVPIAVQVAKGLRRAHDAGLVHRDLKPANIFLVRSDDEDEIVKILDFGIAKEAGASSNSTQTGEFIGSPHYMSPEQIKGSKDVDARSDLWSLGVILFRALTGTLPFQGDTITTLIGSVLTGPLRMPSQYLRNIPAEADAFFRQALDREPAARFQSAREMAAAFGALAGVETFGGGARRASSASWSQADIVQPAAEAPHNPTGVRTSDPGSYSRLSDPPFPRASSPALPSPTHGSEDMALTTVAGISATPSDPGSYARASDSGSYARTPDPAGYALAPDPGSYAHAPDPAGYAHAPDPAGYAHAPDPAGYARTPDPAGYAHAPDPAGYARAPDPAGYALASDPALRASTPTPFPQPASPSFAGALSNPLLRTLPLEERPEHSVAPGSSGMLGAGYGGAAYPAGGPQHPHGFSGVGPGTLTASPSTGDVGAPHSGDARIEARGADRRPALGAKIAMAIGAAVILAVVVMLAARALSPATSASSEEPTAAPPGSSALAAPPLVPSASAVPTVAMVAPTAAPERGTPETAQPEPIAHAEPDAGNTPTPDVIDLDQAAPAPSGPSRVFINVKGGTCKLLVNGMPQGAPPISLTVPSGVTRVTCRTPSNWLHEREVTIAPGATGNVIFTLSSGSPR